MVYSIGLVHAQRKNDPRWKVKSSSLNVADTIQSVLHMPITAQMAFETVAAAKRTIQTFWNVALKMFYNRWEHASTSQPFFNQSSDWIHPNCKYRHLTVTLGYSLTGRYAHSFYGPK